MAIRTIISLAIIVSLSVYFNYQSHETKKKQINIMHDKESLDNSETTDIKSNKQQMSVNKESLFVGNRKTNEDVDRELTPKQMKKYSIREDIFGYQFKLKRNTERFNHERLNMGTSIDTGRLQTTMSLSFTRHLKRSVHRTKKRMKREKERKKDSCPSRNTEFERKCIDILSCCYNVNLKFPNCYCDEMCPLYQDCCPDFNNSSQYNISGTHRNIILKSECSSIRMTFQRGYRLVTKCLKTYTDFDITRKCEDGNIKYLEIIPVTDRYHMTYRNIYCALCNEVYDVIFWNIRFSYLAFKYYYNASSITEFLKPVYFRYISSDLTMFPPEGVYPRTCNQFLYGYIKETGQIVPRDERELKCSAIQRRLNENIRKAYENACSVAAWEYNYCYTRQMHTSCTRCVYHDLSEEGTRWDFFEMYAIFTNAIGHGGCDQNYGWIPTKANENICVHSTPSILNPQYSLNTYFQIEGKQSVYAIDLLHTILFSYIEAISQVEIYLRFNKFEVYEPVGCNICYMEMTLLYVMETNENELFKVSKWFEQFYWSFTLENEDGIINMFRLSREDVKNDTTCEFNNSIPFFNNMFIKENSAIYKNFPRIQRFCQNVSFTLTAIGQNSSVEQLINEVMVTESDCSHVTMVSHDSLGTILTIVTYAIMGAGCVTLIGSIATHVYLNTDVSIPSHITKHMKLSTLLFQILYIVGIGANDDKDLCFSLGVILHYLLLCVFSWKSLCVGYLAHNLRQIRKFPAYAHLDKKKTRYIITCFGYTLPILIVGPSVVIDKCRCTPFNIDYGNGICFPNPSTYLEHSFVVTGPISVHIFFNIGCLIVSLYELSIAKTNIGLLHVSRSYTPIYLKLSVYSGIAWIFGIITLVMPLPIIRTVFILTCCSQGLFLSVITVCNVRVLKSLKTQIFSSGD